MTEDEATGSNFAVAGAALAATLLLVAGVAFLGSSSPWAEAVDPTEGLEPSPSDTDLSTGRMGALVDSHDDGGDLLEVDDGEAVDGEEVDGDLERSVRESVDDLDEETAEEAAGSGDGSGDGGSQEAKDEAVQQVQEDVEEELQRDVDEETLQSLVEQALTERAGEDGGEGSGSNDDGDNTSSSSSAGADQSSAVDREGTTGERSTEQGSRDEAAPASSSQEGSGPPGGDLPSPGVAPVLAVLVAVVALLVVAYRRDALSLDSITDLPHTIAAKASAAAYAAAGLASEALGRIREASTPLEAFHAVAALLRRSLQDVFEDEQRSTEDMASEIAEVGDADGGSVGSARQLVMESWGVLTRASGLDSPDRRTPGQVARAAVARGLPAEPVRRVTDAFREIEYGDGDPEARAEEVRAAMVEIKDAAGGG